MTTPFYILSGIIVFLFLLNFYQMYRYDKMADRLTSKIMSQSYGEFLIGETRSSVEEVGTRGRSDLDEAEGQLKQIGDEAESLEKRAIKASEDMTKVFGN